MEKLDALLKDASEVLLHQTELSYHLGLLAQTAYKHACAQKRFKFFMSVKKVERNMRKFSNLQLQICIQEELRLPSILRGRRDFILNISTLLMKAHLHLKESQKCCEETVYHSLQQLHSHRFIPLHTLLISITSKISSLTKKLIFSVETWYEKLVEIAKVGEVEIPLMQKDEQFQILSALHIAKPKTSKLLSRLHTQFIDTATLPPVEINNPHVTIQQIQPNQMQPIVKICNPHETSQIDMGIQITRADISRSDDIKALKKTIDKSKRPISMLQSEKFQLGQFKDPDLYSTKVKSKLQRKYCNISLKLKPYHLRFMFLCRKIQQKHA